MTKPPNTLFIKNFINQYVGIVTKLQITESINAEDGSILTSNNPFEVHGRLIAEDNIYYYLGGEEISHCVKKSSVFLIKVISENDMMDDMLQKSPSPSSELN